MTSFIMEPPRKITTRQMAVLNFLHDGLELADPVSVDFPNDYDGVAHAKFGRAGESEVIVHIDPEGYVEQTQVRVVVAGTVSWVPLGGGDPVRDRLTNLARQGRRTVAPENNEWVWA